MSKIALFFNGTAAQQKLFSSVGQIFIDFPAAPLYNLSVKMCGQTRYRVCVKAEL